MALSFSCQIEVFYTGLIMSFLSEAHLTAIHYLSSMIDFTCHTTYLLKFEGWYTPDIIIKDKEDNPIYANQNMMNQNMIPLNLQPLETSRLERQVLIILVEELQGMMKAKIIY
ncbi:MAG TPA: hypothetical protein VIW25_06625 [Nitrososphaeraceae archaeon]